MTNRSISVGVKQLEGGFVESIRHTEAPLKRLGEIPIIPFHVYFTHVKNLKLSERDPAISALVENPIIFNRIAGHQGIKGKFL